MKSMQDWLCEKRKLILADINTRANLNTGLLAGVMALTGAVTLAILLTLRVISTQATIALYSAVALCILTSAICLHRGARSRKETKYIACTLILLVTCTVYMTTPQYTQLLLPMGMLITAQYQSRKLCTVSIVGAALLAVICPALSWLLGMWDTGYYLELTRIGLGASTITAINRGASGWSQIPMVLLRCSATELLLTILMGGLLVSIMRLGDADVENRLRIIVLSETDALTGIMNRASFEERIKTFPNECEKRYAVAFIDVNGLHELNNEQGHAAGDRMLCFVADRIRTVFPVPDTYRTGGDEFIVLLNDTPEWTIDERLSSVERACTAKGYSISVGATSAARGGNITEAIDHAEQLMYEAKERYYRESGKDRRRRRTSDN